MLLSYIFWGEFCCTGCRCGGCCLVGTHRGCCCALLLFRDIASDHSSFMKVLQTDTHIFAELFNEFKPKSTRKVKKSKMRFKQYVETVVFYLSHGCSCCAVAQCCWSNCNDDSPCSCFLLVCVWVCFFFFWSRADTWR